MEERNPKDMCLKEIELHAQNLLTILGPIENILGGNLCDQFMAPWLSPLLIHMNSEPAPNLSVIEPGVSIHIRGSAKN